jgi:hypothetical protein
LWLLDRLAQRYRARPSELLSLDNAYDAYCLDEAVLTFCAGVESKLEAVPTPKGKNGHERRQRNQESLLHKLLGMEEEVQKNRKFRDPADMLKGR